jgi:hypothetical protein
MSAQEHGYAQTDARALLLPGLYDVAFDRYYTWMMFGRAPKLTICFKVVTFGEYFEQPLQRHYNVSKLIGRPSLNGRFKAGFCSDFLREFATLFGAPTRLDRIPMSAYANHILIAKVRTVTKGTEQRAIPAGLQYSTISELVGIKQ